MKHKFATLFLLGAAGALECTNTDDCSVTDYGMGACCLIEEEHWVQTTCILPNFAELLRR